MDIQDTMIDLEVYADLEGTEVGELCAGLIRLHRLYPYFLDGKFKEALEKEIEAQLNNFKEFSEIVEKEETRPHKYQELVWNDY